MSGSKRRCAGLYDVRHAVATPLIYFCRTSVKRPGQYLKSSILLPDTVSWLIHQWAMLIETTTNHIEYRIRGMATFYLTAQSSPLLSRPSSFLGAFSFSTSTVCHFISWGMAPLFLWLLLLLHSGVGHFILVTIPFMFLYFLSPLLILPFYILGHFHSFEHFNLTFQSKVSSCHCIFWAIFFHLQSGILLFIRPFSLNANVFDWHRLRKSWKDFLISSDRSSSSSSLPFLYLGAFSLNTKVFDRH